MYWAEERLGNRIANAYTWKSFLKTAGVLPCGSDFPVESIDPIKGFYAATLRKDGNGFPEGGFQLSEALTPVEALKGMTIWAAYAGFSENETGSFRKYTFADFTITNKNLLTSTQSGDCTVKCVYLNGKEVYSK
jgi:predicted amidohydrolase YtcJ